MSDNELIINENGLPVNQETYDAVRGYIVTAQKQVNVALILRWSQHIGI